MGRSTSPVRFPIRLRMTQECGWRWMRLSNTFPLAPEGVRRHRVGNALVKSRQKAQTVAPPKGRRGRPSPAEPGECCELFAAQTGFAFLDANPKGARQVRGPRSELRLRLPKSPPRVASSGIRDGLHRLACSKSLRSRLPRCDQPWGTSKRWSAARPRSLGGRGGVGAWCGHRGSRERRDCPLPASPTVAGRYACTANAIQAPFAATGHDRGQLHEPNTTEVSAWGGLNERLTNVRGIGVPAGRSPCSRTLQ